MALKDPYASGLMTWDLSQFFDTKGMIWFISSARISEILPAPTVLEIKNPLTKSKIRILKVVKGMIESKKTKDTANDRVTQSSLTNLLKEVENRFNPGMFKRMTRVFIITTGRLSVWSPRPPWYIFQPILTIHEFGC